ncbi:MAG: pyruvate, water dikinase regulatory protein [Chloroflexota bacterium]
MLTIFVVSDATGETADRVVRSALVQFPDASVTILRRGQVRTPEQVRAVVEEAAGQPSLILHTLVSDDLRRFMLTETRQHDVDSMDLMGPVLDRLATHLGLSPQEKPGLFRQLVEARSREIEAVEFAFRHDDGQNPEDLDRAEVVLVGISRTMKTPTMLYLAYRGWFAANVPIVPEMTLPPALTRVSSERVFHLVGSPSRLAELRRARSARLGIPPEPYGSLAQVQRELGYAQNVARRHAWKKIDVTGKSVEEVAREIMALLPGEGEGRPTDGNDAGAQ